MHMTWLDEIRVLLKNIKISVVMWYDLWIKEQQNVQKNTFLN